MIQIDYFQTFGNIRELLCLLDTWDLLKQGQAKIIPKDKVTFEPLKQILETHSTAPPSSSSYKISENALLCLYDFEKYIKKNPLPDIPIGQRIKYSLDVLGYADVATNKEEDRRRLLITDVAPVSDNKGSVWAYRVGAQSLGSGKAAGLTVKAEIFNNLPLAAGDIIRAAKLWKNNSGYWYLLDYKKEHENILNQ